MRSALIFCLLWFVQEKSWACTQEDLTKLMTEAQTLAEGTPATGERLIQCASVRDAAVQWLSFYLFMTQGPEPSEAVPQHAVAPEAAAGDKDYQDIIKKAKAGDPEALIQKVEEAAIGFVDKPEAQLTLARGLARKRDFDNSRKAYRAYLRLVSEDLWAETEYLYTFVWAGEYEEAEKQFLQARRSVPGQPLKGAVERGLTLSRELREKNSPMSEKAKGADHTYLSGKFGGEIGIYDIRKRYRRQTAAISYQGPFHARIANHRIQSAILDKYAVNATEVSVGRRWKIADRTYFNSNLGFYSPGKENWFGDNELSIGLPLEFSVRGGYYRTPIGLEYPLTKESQDLMRDAFWLAADWGKLVEMRSELRKDRNYPPHEYHSVVARYPIRDAHANDYLYVRLPASIEIHPKANPNYPSDPRTTRVGLGFDYARPLQGQMQLKLLADYHLINAMYRGKLGQSKRMGKFEMGGELIIRRFQPYEYIIKGHYARVEEEDEIRLYDLLNYISLGVNLAT